MHAEKIEKIKIKYFVRKGLNGVSNIYCVQETKKFSSQGVFR